MHLYIFGIVEEILFAYGDINDTKISEGSLLFRIQNSLKRGYSDITIHEMLCESLNNYVYISVHHSLLNILSGNFLVCR